MSNQIVFAKASPLYRNAIIELLQSEKLPIEDIPVNLDNFIIASDNGRVIGLIGLEKYERYGLLRSLVVHPAYRKMKIGDKLIKQLLQLSQESHLKEIYLLTETAPAYFSRKEFVEITRAEAPESIKQSSEFSHVCPASAILMRKKLSI